MGYVPGGSSDNKYSVRAATTVALPSCTYANGTAGMGASLTATANAAIVAQDGVTLALGNRLLVKNQAAGLQNGPFVVSAVGDGSSPFVLTRTPDADENADVTTGMQVYVEEGTANQKTFWTLTTTGAITVGTTALVFENIPSSVVSTPTAVDGGSASASYIFQYDFDGGAASTVFLTAKGVNGGTA